MSLVGCGDAASESTAVGTDQFSTVVPREFEPAEPEFKAQFEEAGARVGFPVEVIDARRDPRAVGNLSLIFIELPAAEGGTLERVVQRADQVAKSTIPEYRSVATGDTSVSGEAALFRDYTGSPAFGDVRVREVYTRRGDTIYGVSLTSDPESFDTDQAVLGDVLDAWRWTD
jgi:hypothetical protein